METERTTQPAGEWRPVEEDDLALAQAELAARPGLVAAATAEGREVDLAHLLARKPILEHKIAYLKGSRDETWQAILDAYLAEARDRHEQVKAEQAGLIAELEGRLAEANAKAAAAWAEVIEARWAAEEESRRKPDWWWEERGLAPPGATPVADEVKRRIVPDRRMASFYAERGDTRFGPSPVRYEESKDERVPTPPVVQQIVEGTYQPVGGGQ
jgi:hypothetical protein